MKKPDMRIAILGATGLVGQELQEILAKEGGFSKQQILLSSSSRREGFYTIPELLNDRAPNFLFSALPSEVARTVLPAFVERGATVIDKSSAFRLQEDPHIPLIVPEVNGHELTGEEKLIASPNCVAVPLSAALAPLHREYRLRSAYVATYQSASGAGREGAIQLTKERQSRRIPDEERVFEPHLHDNVIPFCGEPSANGETSEEIKVAEETKRILGIDDVSMAIIAARVPVMRGHSMAIFTTFDKPLSLPQVHALLGSETTGLDLFANTDEYPTVEDVSEENNICVGRMVIDTNNPQSMSLWVTSDNLRKGAALNAWQIMELIIKKRGWS